MTRLGFRVIVPISSRNRSTGTILCWNSSSKLTELESAGEDGGGTWIWSELVSAAWLNGDICSGELGCEHSGVTLLGDRDSSKLLWLPPCRLMGMGSED